jgi:ATP-binding cassette subfamily C protein LapB
MHMGTQRNATLVEALTGLDTIKAIGAESLFQRKWEEASGYIAHWAIKARALSSSALNLSMFLQHMATVSAVVVGVYLIARGELSMGGLIACVILMGRTMAPMAQVANLSTRYNQAKAALKSLNEVVDLPQERGENQAFVHHPVLGGTFEFSKVGFSYPNSPVPALENISFKIRAGEKVGIIGGIGSGKSTLHKLMSGLYEPDAGSILVDGTDLHQIDPADLRRNIGYVSQDPLLFFGSIRDNLLLGNPTASDPEILQAAEVAGVTEFVNRHPHGFDLQVGERGSNLSGGQRQAVTLARALLHDPPVLLLDEPTNSMDNKTEQRFKQHLKTLIEGKTLVVMTHRASLLELVERILVLDNGRLIADGPKELVIEALRAGRLHGAQR